MPLPIPENSDPFRRLEAIMEALLSPKGCPWDQKQDHKSLKPYVIEESYEVCEAIDDGNMEELRGELGDLGLQIVFHAALAKRAGHFTVDDVYAGICEKLIRRHPHVFGDGSADDAGQVVKNWEAIKKQERAEKNADAEQPPSALAGIPAALPALQRAYRLQAKAARVGFDWNETAPVLDKIREEFDEVEAEIRACDAAESTPESDAPAAREKLAGEIGDLLFAIVNLARFLHIEPEQALQQTNRKFQKRFEFIEEALHAQGREPADSDLEEMDALWEKAKREMRG